MRAIGASEKIASVVAGRMSWLSADETPRNRAPIRVSIR